MHDLATVRLDEEWEFCGDSGNIQLMPTGGSAPRRPEVGEMPTATTTERIDATILLTGPETSGLAPHVSHILTNGNIPGVVRSTILEAMMENTDERDVIVIRAEFEVGPGVTRPEFKAVLFHYCYEKIQHFIWVSRVVEGRSLPADAGIHLEVLLHKPNDTRRGLFQYVAAFHGGLPTFVLEAKGTGRPGDLAMILENLQISANNPKKLKAVYARHLREDVSVTKVIFHLLDETTEQTGEVADRIARSLENLIPDYRISVQPMDPSMGLFARSFAEDAAQAV
jgi:hypothetical protein